MAEVAEKMELIETFIGQIAEGVPLRQLCRLHGIGKSTWYEWVKADEEKGGELAGRIARARLDGFDAIAEETLEIADDSTNDWVERERDDGSKYEALNGEHVQRSKLRVETRLKLLAKWDPKRYGDKTLIGSDPDNPLPAGFKVEFVRGAGDAEG